MPARVDRSTGCITPVRLPMALLCMAFTALAGLAACSRQRADDRTATFPPSLGAPLATTRAGMWWGVDSSGPITEAALDNVRGWYRGATPQFWGRYVSGHYAVSARELALARHKGIYVYLLVNDRNCSRCDGGRDVCGHDHTAGQARADALAAIRAAKQSEFRRTRCFSKTSNRSAAAAESRAPATSTPSTGRYATPTSAPG